MNKPVDATMRRQRLDRFAEIIIDHPRMVELHAKMVNLMNDTAAAIARHERRKIQAGGRPIKAEELWMLPVIGPSGATKSRSITTFVDKMLSDPNLPPDEIPILLVTVRSSSRSPKHLQSQILEAFGDPSAETILRDRSYSEAAVNEAIRKIARKRRTSLVILDETHSMLIHGGGANARAMSNLMKSIVNDGVFSLVVVGTDEMKPILRQTEGRSRLLEPVDFRRFGLALSDINYFLAFVAMLEKRMVKDKVIDRPIGLTFDVDSQAQVYDMADGVIGTVSRVLYLALCRVLDDGKTTIEIKDVRDAFVSWNATLDKPVRNPFSKLGPTKNARDAMTAAAAAAAEAEAAAQKQRLKQRGGSRNSTISVSSGG